MYLPKLKFVELTLLTIFKRNLLQLNGISIEREEGKTDNLLSTSVELWNAMAQ